MLRVKFPLVQYTDLSEIDHVLKAVAIVTHERNFCLSATVCPEWRLNLGFGTQEECPFPLNRGVPLIKVTNTKIM